MAGGRLNLIALGLATAVLLGEVVLVAFPERASQLFNKAMGSAAIQVERFAAERTIVNLDPGRHLVTINHGDIKGLMSPMTMAFPVASPALFERIAAGDRVTFTLQRSAQGLAIIALIKQQTSGEASIVLAIEHDLSQLTAPGPESPGGASGCQTYGGELYDEASGCEL